MSRIGTFMMMDVFIARKFQSIQASFMKWGRQTRHRIYEWNSLNEPQLLDCHILLLLLLGWYDYNLGSPRMIVDDWNGGVQQYKAE